SASASNSAARTVSNRASPGPAPTKLICPAVVFIWLTFCLVSAVLVFPGVVDVSRVAVVVVTLASFCFCLVVTRPPLRYRRPLRRASRQRDAHQSAPPAVRVQ